MIRTEIPIGEVINFLHENNDFQNIDHIKKRIDNIVDLITLRSNKIGLHETLVSVQDELFKLRFEIMSKSSVFVEIIKKTNHLVQEKLKHQINRDTNFKDLELAYIRSMDIYRIISKSIVSNLTNNDSSFSISENLPDLNYFEYIALLNNLPTKDAKRIVAYLQASITLDFALIATELVFDEELKLSKKNREELYLMLKNSTEEYAILSNQLGFWKPKEDDEAQWIRNIKIRISLLNSTNVASGVSLDAVKEIITC